MLPNAKPHLLIFVGTPSVQDDWGLPGINLPLGRMKGISAAEVEATRSRRHLWPSGRTPNNDDALAWGLMSLSVPVNYVHLPPIARPRFGGDVPSDSVEKLRVVDDAPGGAFDGRLIHASQVRHDRPDAVGGDAAIRTLAHAPTDQRRAVRYGRGHLVVARVRVRTGPVRPALRLVAGLDDGSVGGELVAKFPIDD